MPSKSYRVWVDEEPEDFYVIKEWSSSDAAEKFVEEWDRDEPTVATGESLVVIVVECDEYEPENSIGSEERFVVEGYYEPTYVAHKADWRIFSARAYCSSCFMNRELRLRSRDDFELSHDDAVELMGRIQNFHNSERCNDANFRILWHMYEWGAC